MGEGKVLARKDVLDHCESDFEKEFGARLIDYGYRIRPQVPVAGFRIDFVIEGADGRRLAVELDGDKWHGPERWADDFRRQKALERFGWTFWRCWGSNWIADKEGCLADLLRTLKELEIEPLGAEPLQGSWTEFRDVRADPPPAAPTNGENALAAADAVQASAPTTVSEPFAAVATGAAPEPDAAERITAQAGDLVVLRYNDAPERPLRVTISTKENKPDLGIVHVSQPLGRALIGAGEEDEIEINLGSMTRVGIIEKIERRRTGQAGEVA
jgi:very-short-patch-repair endonuclease/transcription elongation GreA/GreB family factor